MEGYLILGNAMRRSLVVAGFLARKLVLRSNWGLNIMAVLMIVLVYININFTSSLLNGFIGTVNNKLISAQTGNIIVFSNSNSGISDSGKLIDSIASIPGVEGVTGSRSLPAQISRDGKKTVAEVSGINTDSYGDVFITPKNMIEGEFINKDDKDKIVLGAQIAGADISRLELYSDSLKNVHAGDKVMVSFSTGTQKEYTVKGIFLNEFFESDIKTFLSNTEFDALEPNSNIENINIKLSAQASEPTVIDNIKSIRSDLEFRTWQERSGYVRGFTDTLTTVNRILRIVALLVAAVTIFIVTYVDLVSKRRQIGIERAIGISSPTIISSYLFRAGFYTLVGSAIGAAIFIWVIVPIERTYSFTSPYGKVLLAVDYRFMVINTVILLLVGLVAALVPAWRTIRISIIDAIWGN